ncbi:MAG: hypothetical protein ETSY2_38515 [Candidatus Entotheonella gemina]|uniref:Tripartite ATP-independent periplasmic transporters DctQ component domain-containing protein n=1 Tax=Candidatus Entotheonella gemina TaxID=1429439 RepID=W4LRU9_9BACT|nr:MAG: hypothetical protein ETSY2_38515 [Candidatus Entotheonella gemina]
MAPRAGRSVRLVDRGVRFLAFLGGLALVWLMGLTVVAVIMRYVFGAPILGAQDISEMSLVLVAFLGLAYSGWTGAHIAVDLIGGMLPPGLTRWTDTVVRLIGAGLMAVVTWQTVRQGLDAAAYGEATNLVENPSHAVFHGGGARLRCLYGGIVDPGGARRTWCVR